MKSQCCHPSSASSQVWVPDQAPPSHGAASSASACAPKPDLPLLMLVLCSAQQQRRCCCVCLLLGTGHRLLAHLRQRPLSQEGRCNTPLRATITAVRKQCACAPKPDLPLLMLAWRVAQQQRRCVCWLLETGHRLLAHLRQRPLSLEGCCNTPLRATITAVKKQCACAPKPDLPLLMLGLRSAQQQRRCCCACLVLETGHRLLAHLRQRFLPQEGCCSTHLWLDSKHSSQKVHTMQPNSNA